VLTTVNTAETNGLTCLPKHGHKQYQKCVQPIEVGSKFLVCFNTNPESIVLFEGPIPKKAYLSDGAGAGNILDVHGEVASSEQRVRAAAHEVVPLPVESRVVRVAYCTAARAACCLCAAPFARLARAARPRCS
jgi:hypothetical protein